MLIGLPRNPHPAETWADSNSWPPEIELAPLIFGSDGLTDIAPSHYRKALEELARVDEVSLLAAPDLVFHEDDPVRAPAPPPPLLDCASLEAPAQGSVIGVVTSVENGRQLTVAGVRVRETQTRREVVSGADGRFELDGLPVGLVQLLLEKADYEVREQLARSVANASGDPAQFPLERILTPQAFTDEEILGVQRQMAAQGAAGLYRMPILDAPRPEMDVDDIRQWRAKLGDTSYAGLFYPWPQVEIAEEVRRGRRDVSALRAIPPSGQIAGQTAHADLSEGVHRAAANFPLQGVRSLSVEINDAEHAVLHPAEINVIRSFAGRGIRLHGWRTLSSDAEWRYISVRRLVMAIEKTLEKSLQWAVFESNDSVLRQAVNFHISSLLTRLWRSGALAGKTAEAAYRVKCDLDNNPQASRDAGRLIAEVAVAPAVPFEFIAFRLGLTRDAVEVTE